MVFGSIGCNNKLLDLVKVPDSLLSLISAIIFCVLCVSFSSVLSIIDKTDDSYLNPPNVSFCFSRPCFNRISFFFNDNSNFTHSVILRLPIWLSMIQIFAPPPSPAIAWRSWPDPGGCLWRSPPILGISMELYILCYSLERGIFFGIGLLRSSPKKNRERN